MLVLSFHFSLLGAIDLNKDQYFIPVLVTLSKIQTYHNPQHQKLCLFVYLFILLRHYISQTFCSCTNTWENKLKAKKTPIDSLKFNLKTYFLTEKQLACKYFIINNEDHLKWPVYSTINEHSKRSPKWLRHRINTKQ